ncbi:hypothetical protein GCM10009865_03920 [Aeromicrobium ponti]
MPSGTSIIGTFPEFDAEYEVYIDESLYLQSDYVCLNLSLLLSGVSLSSLI